MKSKLKIDRIRYNKTPVPPQKRLGLWPALKKFIMPVTIFCFPILYLCRHVIAINGQYTAIDNDFVSLYYRYKLYLLANLAEFRFPLWSPSEAAGFPFYNNPFSQMFYPLNLILVIWYKILGGYNQLDYQLFTIIGISIFALGLFMWLKLINKNIRAVFFATLVMSVSFKVTEIIRFPNAVHSAAWYPWVLFAMTKIMLSVSIKQATAYGTLLAFSLICMCTAGYPYYAYYSIFLFIPYLLVFLVKPLRIRLIGLTAIKWKHAIITLLLSGIIASTICGPYIISIKQLMSQTIDRAGKDFTYSTEQVFNFEDTLGSLVYPPAASAEGWYFFSIISLLIVILYLFSKNNNFPEPLKRSNFYIKLFFLIWIALISYISYGRSSCLFKLLWNYMPGFSSLRIWGRFNIVLVPIIAWLVSIAYAWFENIISGGKPATENNKKQTWFLILTLLCSYALIICVQLYFYLNNICDGLWAQYFDSLSKHRIWFIIYGAVAAIAIMLFVLLGRKKTFVSSRYLNIVCAILVLIAVIEMRHTAIHIWTYQKKWKPQRTKLNIARINKSSFQYKRIDINFTIAISPVFSTGIIENWYLKNYVQFLKNTENETEARKILLGVSDGTRIFFSESIKYPTVTSFLRDANRYASPAGKLVSYTGDELVLEIEAPTSGYMSFIDNWTSDWKAWIDEQPVQIELLFGTFKSVRLTQGRHRVRFCYQPAVFSW